MKKEDIVRNAARLFRDKGYERTTVRDLAQAVGMQSGSLFYHFKTKEAMLVAVMAWGIETTTHRLEAALAQSSSPLDKLKMLFRIHLQSLLGEQQAALEVMLYEWHSLSEAVRPGLIVLRDAYEALWQAVLEEAAAEGWVSTETALLRRTLLGGLHWTVQWYKPAGRLSVNALADEMLHLILKKQPNDPSSV